MPQCQSAFYRIASAWFVLAASALSAPRCSARLYGDSQQQPSLLPLPRKTFAAPDSNREYLALLSFLPLKHYRMIPKFLWLTFETQREHRKSKGLIGYSLPAQSLRRRFWTLSVWEDQQSLMNFFRQAPHGKIMRVLRPHMGKTQFVRRKATVRTSDPGGMKPKRVSAALKNK